MCVGHHIVYWLLSFFLSLDLMSTPVSTKCDHQFCRFCILKLLDSTKKREANCPICKAKVTKRSLQESPGFQRLVEGLKNMVQAFEQDTLRDFSENSCTRTVHLLVGMDKSNTVSSFFFSFVFHIAKNGFARLMGLEDSSTFISEEGLPSGAHDIPKTSGELDIRSTCDIFVPNTDTLGLKLEKPSIEGKKSCEMGVKIVLPHEESFQHTQGCEDMEICSEENQTDSKRDKILNNSEKKSLEKVSKWLLNISPNDRDKGDPNLDGICHEDSHDCTSRGERSSFTAKGNKDEVQSRNPKQLNHRLPLEEKVFGVTYKRHRKSSGAQISSALPNIRAAVEQPTCGSAEKVQSKTVKKMRIKKLTPTDFIKRPYTGVEGHSPVKDELEGGREVCALKGQSADAGAKTRIDERRETGTDGRILKEKKLLEEEGIVIDGPVGQGTTRNNLQNEFQEFSDGLIPKLTETENGKANKCKQKRNRSNRSAKSCAKKKLFRKPKALDLICGGLSSSDSAPSPSERPSFHEVQIESYPSSNHRGTPDLKGFQQSGRLQPFTKNIQESTRKDHQVDSRNTVLPDSKNGQVQCSAEHEDAERTVMSSSGGKKNVMERPVVQNCCIAFEDMIEIMKDDTSVHTNSEEQCQKQPGTSEHGSHLSFVPNTETLHVSPQHSLIRGPILTETEDCRNDGELDTELLLKTFKSTKRRSFLIGSPSSKRSNRSSFAADKCNLEEEQKNDVCDKKGPEKEPETLYVEDSVELVQQGRETLSFGVVNHLASEETKNKNLHYSPKLSCVGSTNPSVCDVSAQKSCRRQRRKFRNQRRTTSKPLETEDTMVSTDTNVQRAGLLMHPVKICRTQKLAMQEELHRLEKMMALVTEALHQKGGTPEPPTPHSAEPAGETASPRCMCVCACMRLSKWGSAARTHPFDTHCTKDHCITLVLWTDLRCMSLSVCRHSADKELVCERTLKYFLGIAGRKWVVSFHLHYATPPPAPFEVRGDMATGRSHRGPEKARNTNEQKVRGWRAGAQTAHTHCSTRCVSNNWLVGEVDTQDPQPLER
uniref:RING-type domain-containing protein n=1 Tax=Scleropages formosus TaxID=113540 RepID=A0A8C9VXZ3_SCLFO